MNSGTFKSFDAACAFYTFGLFAATLFMHFWLPALVRHGRGVGGVSKLCYSAFYLLATAIALQEARGCFIIHPARRLVETLIYSWNSRSKMSYLQLAHGMLYYFMITHYVSRIHLNLAVFLFLNALQAVAHFRVYRLKKREFTHYYAEILIHGYIFLCAKTYAMLWNLMYVIAFVYSSIANRRQEPAGPKLKRK